MKQTLMKYKFLKVVFTLIVLLFFGSSCDKWLTVVPDDGIYSQSYWKEVKDVENTLSGCYSALSRCVDKLYILGEIRSDEMLKGSKESSDIWRLKEGRITSDLSIIDWNNFYYTINLCNTVIKYAPKVLESDNSASPAQVNSLIAEAYFIRSLTYFYLVRFYKEVPLIIAPYEINTDNFDIPKSDERTVLNQIISDLEANVKYANDLYTELTFETAQTTEDMYRLYANFGKVTKAAYWALLSDVYLWTYQYQKSSDCCDSIILAGRHRLLWDRIVEKTSTDYPAFEDPIETTWFDNFYSGNLIFDEHIFTILFLNNTGSNNVSLYSSDNDGANLNVYANREVFVNLFVNLDDIRGDYGTYVDSDTKPLIWKWTGSGEQSSGKRTVNTASDTRYPNWIVYRYADVLLMKAEALGELGMFDKSTDLINQVRLRAGATLLQNGEVSDVFTLENTILDERQRELAFEGKRWFDLIRFARRNNYSRIDLVSTAATSYVPTTTLGQVTYSVSDTMGWYYPIPKSEITRNSALLQNKFYDR
jgi:starch-binding outer membrane protein, SusD/RagB family